MEVWLMKLRKKVLGSLMVCCVGLTAVACTQSSVEENQVIASTAAGTAGCLKRQMPTNCCRNGEPSLASTR